MTELAKPALTKSNKYDGKNSTSEQLLVGDLFLQFSSKDFFVGIQV